MCAVIVAAAGALAVEFIGKTDHRTAPRVHVTLPPAPTVPVAVLNASTTQGAAARLAQQLRRRKVRIAAVGNLGESLPAGVDILYAPGARQQALMLARLLPSMRSTIEPIDPVAQAAAGAATPLALVIG
jgi:hypothetical protein